MPAHHTAGNVERQGQHQVPQATGSCNCRPLLAHGARRIILVDLRLLQEDVERLLVLRQRVASNLVDKLLQPLATILNELVGEEPWEGGGKEDWEEAKN